MEFISQIFAVQLLMLIITVINSYILPHEVLNRDTKNVTQLEKDQELFNRTRRTAATTDKSRLWDKGIIPYVFDNVFAESQKRLIKKAMREWERSTCITFVKRIRGNQAKFLKFTKLNCGCCFMDSPIYRNVKLVSLQNNKCINLPIILHELGHAIGFEHEHNRPDRDKYVDIIDGNIHPDYVDQFTKLSHGEVKTFNQSYDYRSVMHYPQESFSYFSNMKTLIPREKNENITPAIGYNNKLSLGDSVTTNILYQCPKCGGTLLGPSGFFKSPINPNGSLVGSERCEWRIRAAEGEKIEVYITGLSIYETHDCAVDYLEIKNGYRTDGQVLARYCGDSYTAYVIASNYLLVTYVKNSDKSIYNRFLADYKTICGGDVGLEKDTPFNFESTNYPDKYPPNRRCIWYFTAPENHRIVMKINYFALEMSDDCINDFLEIRDGNDEHAVLIGLYCGAKYVSKVNSTKNKLSVVFGSNNMKEHFGFSSTLTAILIEN
ncbi:dorsal-ventral patterning protein tolloid-like [Microplitis mediator]|uniref:dorsal-ventral patterning protein tolloid-like n=1 Tax=Microplitis mediator TaxID=375433 RepID=UPI002555F215|nr:dorsal-ventral patterning protein tolloid-like [Microplitis mediator]